MENGSLGDCGHLVKVFRAVSLEMAGAIEAVK